MKIQESFCEKLLVVGWVGFFFPKLLHLDYVSTFQENPALNNINEDFFFSGSFSEMRNLDVFKTPK